MAKRYGVSFWGNENVLKLIVEMIPQLRECIESLNFGLYG